MATTDTLYTSISQLQPLTDNLQDSDLFVISHLSTTIDADEEKYESLKTTYGDIKTQLCSYFHDNMFSKTDNELSVNLADLSAQYVDLSSNVDMCLSAIVAFDNCRTKLAARVAALEDRVTDIENAIINN